jgi:hypothetical protein
MTKRAITTREQSIEEMFVTELDTIYYPGYAEEIASVDPEKYKWELAEYRGQFKNEYVNA